MGGNSTLIRHVAVAVLALQAAGSFGQNAGGPVKRPKIGLVLEGGGALGFAHIGVLQWLEDHRIPVDYVAGTSMGGLIGGLYASGQRPSEIRALARDINWDKTLSAEVPMQDLTFRRKEDSVDFPNALQFGLKHGLGIPGGLNSGQEIGLILDRAVVSYYDLKTFDDLPIPFRCVATEMVSGKQTIFDHGSLATALRSTMSIPAVFSPVHDGNKIYTDGGALNNLPVDVAKSMGADVIIAVYLDEGAADPKSFNSLLGSAARDISIMIAANEIKSMQEADILLSADLKGFTAADFSKSEQIYPKGIGAAAKKAALLERFSLTESDWKQYLAGRDAKKRINIPVPEFVAVDGGGPQEQKSVERSLARLEGKPFNADAMDEDLRKLRGIGDLDSLSYSFVVKNNQPGLEIQAVDKGYAPPYLNLGINIDGADTRDIRFGMSGRLTLVDLGGYRSELRTNAYFGAASGLNAEYFHPFTGFSHWFIAPRAYASTRDFDVYENRARVSQFRIGNRGTAVDLGYSLSRRSELRVGESLDWETGRLVIGFPLAPNGEERRQISAVHYRYIGQDDPIIPRNGFTLQSDLSYFNRRQTLKQGYTTATARFTYFKSISANGSLVLTGAGGTAFGATGLGGDAFSLGGPLNLGAYDLNELLGNQYYLFQAGYLRQLLTLNPIFGDRLYATSFYEVGKVYAPLLPNTPKNPMDVTGAIVAKTLLGPVFIGGSVGDGLRAKWWFGLGKIF